MRARALRRIANASGQSVIEFALVLPLIILLVLGVVEFSYALLDAHVVTKATREGSNLISRDTTLQDAVAAMRSMSDRPLNFDDGSSKVIFSVIKRGGTTGTTNFNKNVLYQRYSYGTFPGSTVIATAGAGAFGPAPDYQAINSDDDASLQVTSGLPAGVLVAPGGMIYVTEIYTKHVLITPFNQFGVKLPETLYSIAYF
jgi:hypothetical protein